MKPPLVSSAVLIAGLIIMIAVALVSSGALASRMHTDYQFNEDQIECYENAMTSLTQEANATAGSFNIQAVRCMDNAENGQRSMQVLGTYFAGDDHSREPKPFQYVLFTSGGRSSGGSDTYVDSCFSVDGQPVSSSTWRANTYLKSPQNPPCTFKPT